ncbi:DUF2163 domain-containing protein [Mesorhizobium sp. M8A.F.Ca.ET.021.01.1.1]|uniref:baseplate hub domain-containing protein n=1 Tax=Mesorhizobium sp. M8A.F.Ca.ET.021.01.1.1 TaxID=2496757 RepID=UPI000FCA9403|nr:DUF2163 domain-containing protein [Mesorhizobium sp. M8A.F.Ca.ET.021.01.1.1]RUW56358.1 DUF2163 domain-containing protein [Mesorhizobium sp. M8A.F.Ca.ET.021.01.1.1]
MKLASLALQNHLKQSTTTITTLWKITRMDGKVFAFTEHDRDVTYQGRTYKSTGGFNKSAVKSTGTFSVDNLEVNGFLSDDTIPDDELRNGAFDYAEVEIFLINYMDTSMGDLKLRYGFFGEVRSAPSGMFLVELRGLIQLMQVRIGETYVPECKADLGDSRCKVVLQPEPYKQTKLYKVDDRMIVATEGPDDLYPPVALVIQNHDFETGDLTGWQSGGGVIPGTINLDPYTPEGGNPADNQFFLNLDIPVFRKSQAGIVLNADPVAIDTGKLTLKFMALTAALELNSGATVQIIFTNTGGGAISSFTQDLGVQTPERVWRESSFECAIPVGSRKVTIFLGGYNNDPMGFMQTCYDNIRGEILFPDPAEFIEENQLDYRIYGGVEWRATTAGVSGTLTKDDFIGQTTVVDGDVTWEKVDPKHMFLGTVSENATISTQLVTDTAAIIARPTGWFNWGVLKFLTGQNRGRAVEVQVHSGGNLTLAMPLPYPSADGDIFQLHTGCDKSRETCFGKFSNILNMRAEPDVPGMNQYFKVGGMT